ncbi:MAG: glycosyltransferase family 2 protein [Snowella sp.]
MKITVIVPTYRRPKDLSRCLEALKKQTRPADEIVVVVRDTDQQTWDFLKLFNQEFLPLHTETVITPGMIAALNVGLDAATGDIISFTDDDAAPHTDWLERIEAHFLSDERLGGLGGRDWVYFGTELYKAEPKEEVGRIQWFGRVIGNHHLGSGKVREVDILKGVNMSFRRTAIANKYFDRRMRGITVIHSEIEFCLALKKAGWKLIYDPMLAVDHYRGERFDEDKRDQFSAIAMTNIVHNKTLALLEHLSPTRRAIFLLWSVLIGTRSEPGFFQWLRFLPREGRLSRQKWLASLRGVWQGWQTWQQSKFPSEN